MCYKCTNSFLALLILVFSFWMTSFSWWVIVIAAALIFIKGIYQLSKDGCDGLCMSPGCGTEGSKTGTELFMEKSTDKVESEPSKEEVKETLKRRRK